MIEQGLVGCVRVCQAAKGEMKAFWALEQPELSPPHEKWPSVVMCGHLPSSCCLTGCVGWAMMGDPEAEGSRASPGHPVPLSFPQECVFLVSRNPWPRLPVPWVHD